MKIDVDMSAEEQLRTTRNGRQFKCERCLKWRHFDLGHSEGNECIKCFAEIERKIVAFVRAASWRLETTIIGHMLHEEPILTETRIEEWLSELVEVEGSLEWFTRGTEERIGPNAYSSEPLRYRFIPKRKRKKDGDRRVRRHQRAVPKRTAAAKEESSGRASGGGAEQARRS